MKKIIKIFIIIILLFISIIVMSEFNHGIIPLGKKAYIDCPNISSIIAKKQADKYMDALTNKDIELLYTLIIDSGNNKTIDKYSYKEKMEIFYSKVKINDYKYQFFYYDDNAYVFAYTMPIEYQDEIIEISLQIKSHKENIELLSFGTNDNKELDTESDLYNLMSSIFSE